MRKTALALTALAVAAGPLASTSRAADPANAPGCVTTYASYRYPAPTVVTRDPSGRIIIDPNGANAFIASFYSRTNAFVACVV